MSEHASDCSTKEKCACFHAAGVCTDATGPNSMGLCLGGKPEKPNEQALLECYQKRRNR